jgi:hypothetical protein
MDENDARGDTSIAMALKGRSLAQSGSAFGWGAERSLVQIQSPRLTKTPANAGVLLSAGEVCCGPWAMEVAEQGHNRGTFCATKGAASRASKYVDQRPTGLLHPGLPAHSAGGRKVAGSNPVAPIERKLR